MNVIPFQPLQAYQLKVALNGIKPMIWRRILVSNDINLGELHDYIQRAMGWDEEHLHSFSSADERIFIPILDQEDLSSRAEDESQTALVEVMAKKGDKLQYTYDFGDNWEHTITLEKVRPVADLVESDFCLAGKRACPPENCGGLSGYKNLLRIIVTPSHEDHLEVIDWLGEYYDPEYFDAEDVNMMLEHESFDDENFADMDEFASQMEVQTVLQNQAMDIVLRSLLATLQQSQPELYESVKSLSQLQATSLLESTISANIPEAEEMSAALVEVVDDYFAFDQDDIFR
ncbi:plasmid pRiA4b ORF-3 family protein [Vibrio tapetis]|uniref:Plasmid pRiA4b Orf3-like domain-containing protein n=1 Tax=Vibrio tapetis subsp. tapetis TaxID=1671868 RepID=A0A2N8ZKA0_9VIBR|nr:plasmid pRiA4b ORF-3 family protein [Vibrio tapetis]SON52339.1 conserved protein of unknown function [Vibrio tapetis subsp. tapetis]